MIRAPFVSAPEERCLPHLFDASSVEQDARCGRCGETVSDDLWGRDAWDRVVHWECDVLPEMVADSECA